MTLAEYDIADWVIKANYVSTKIYETTIITGDNHGLKFCRLTGMMVNWDDILVVNEA